MEPIRISQFGKEVLFTPVNGRIGAVLKTGVFYETCPKCIITEWHKRYPVGSLRTVIDVGANIGNHTLYLACVAQAALVEAIEPCKKTYNILRQNVALNDVSIGMWNVFAGEVQERKTWRAIEADTIRLDDIVVGKLEVDLVKIDVEDNHMSVLRGATDLLWKSNAEWWIEINEGPFTVDYVDGFMEQFGYKREDFVYNWTPTYCYKRVSK